MKTVLVFCLFAALIGTHPVEAASPAPSDFAYGCPLPLVEGDGVYSFNIPLAVYEKVTRDDLGDLRVFNGSGETVPHAIRRAPGEGDRKQLRQPVPFFPLPGHRQPLATDLSLRVVRNADGAVVTVNAGNITAAAPSPSSSYLLDTTKLAPTPTELELQWNGGTGAVFTVSLVHSSDLVHWSPLVGQTVLADLRYNGSSVIARRILLPGKTLPYIRLDCLDCREPLLLHEVRAVSGTAATPDQWQWLRLNPEKAGEGEGELVFAYRREAKVMVTALQLRFAETNSLVRAVIESRPSADASWQTRAQGNFYNLNLQGRVLVNEMALCPPTADRHWRLRIVADGAGLGGNKQAPQLELGWRQEQLVFVGRGRGPYLLAFGSTRLADLAATQDDLVLAAMRDTGSEALLQRIEPGPLQTLSGEKALHPQLSAASWKKILLWGVLLAGVGLLALMARTLYREIQAKNS